jgi:hypothetical protein
MLINTTELTNYEDTPYELKNILDLIPDNFTITYEDLEEFSNEMKENNNDIKLSKCKFVKMFIPDLLILNNISTDGRKQLTNLILVIIIFLMACIYMCSNDFQSLILNSFGITILKEEDKTFFTHLEFNKEKVDMEFVKNLYTNYQKTFKDKK